MNIVLVKEDYLVITGIYFYFNKQEFRRRQLNFVEGGVASAGSYKLKWQSQQLSSALSPTCDFKSHFCQLWTTSRSSLIWVHTVCLYAKIGLKSLQEYTADNINRQHFQMQVFLAF